MKTSIINQFSKVSSASALALLSLSLLAASSASGAVSYFQGTITSASDVLNTGTLVIATDLGPGAPAVTVNGVAFGADSGVGLTGFVNSNTGVDLSNQFPAGSPLDQLLSGQDYQAIGLGSSSLTLSGLAPGTSYLFQMFLSNISNNTGKSSRITIQGQAFNLANYGNDADYVRAYFTASTSTEVVQFGNGSAFETDRMGMNAFELSANPAPAPEPGTLAFSTLAAALALAARRMKKV